MGCCGKNKKKVKSKSDVSKNSKTEKKRNSLHDQEKKIPTVERIDEVNHPKKTESNLQQDSIPTPVVENTTQVTSPLERQIKSPSLSSPDYDIDAFIHNISSTDNISPIKTLNDLQIFVQQKQKSISIVLFYGRYCPYSRRTMPGLRHWARANQDRIFLYEADVEQATKLAEYYHIRTIPTIMAFEEKNLLAPIWQRTANNVLPSSTAEEFEPIEGKLDTSNNIYVVLDPSIPKSDHMETSNENKQEQYLIILDKIQDPNLIDESNSVENWPSKSIESSEQSPYIWDRSIQSLETDSQKSSKKSLTEYNGRMISQSTISTDHPLKKKRTWSEYLDDHKQTNEYHQHVHLPNCHEIFYEKQYDHSNEFNPSLSSDRFSTLTYQHVKDTNNLSINQQEETCVLYLGPNRQRGFEDNSPDKIPNPSKFSLLTLQSQILSE